MKTRDFNHISTDEVYGTLGDNGYFTEDTPILHEVHIVQVKQVQI